MVKFLFRILAIIALYIPSNCRTENTAASHMAFIALEFMKNRNVNEAVIFNCEHYKDNIPLIRSLGVQGMRLTLQPLVFERNLSYLLSTKYRPLAVIADMKCEQIFETLIKASEKKLFSNLHYWLLLNLHNKSNQAIFDSLEPLYLTLNSHITIAYQEPGLKRVLLQDAYRLKDKQPLILAPYPIWTLGETMPSPPRRDNYGGLSIRAAVVVSESTPWESFLDIGYRHLDTESKLLYLLMTYNERMLNFRMNVSLTNTWGYPLNGSKCFNGAVGLLQCGDSEMIASGLLYKEERMDVIDYAGDTVKFRSAFFFLKPPLSGVSNTYILPFSPSVWITYALSVVVLMITSIFITYSLKEVISSSSEELLPLREFMLDAVAIVCQQGTTWNPAGISSRIVFLLQLMLSVFLFTSYSAIIVSLLQTSSDRINNINDLMNSSMKLSMFDIYINEITDPQVKRLFEQKLYKQPPHEAFTTQEVGMEKIRKGLFAFHGAVGAYKIISDTYEEQEKCRLKQIPMFTLLDISFVVKKSSPFGEHIKQKTNWLRETGLLDHEDKRWFYQTPKCEGSVQFVVSISIQDFYPTLVVLSFGIISSIVILFFEFLYAYATKKHGISALPCIP